MAHHLTNTLRPNCGTYVMIHNWRILQIWNCSCIFNKLIHYFPSSKFSGQIHIHEYKVLMQYCLKKNQPSTRQPEACTNAQILYSIFFGVCRFLCFWMCTIMWVWAINSSCDRKMRRVENVPWESEKMQNASNRVGKISNWEAESCSLMEGTRKRRSFPNSSDERVGAIDESRLALIRLSWHWDDSASSPPTFISFHTAKWL